jgi:putative aldouronate transport system permease protein
MLNVRKKATMIEFKRQLPMHLMLLPCIIPVLIFSYYPMVGILVAFERFFPNKGFFNSPFVGLKNFAYVLNMPNTYQVLWNTVFISVMKIAAGLIIPVLFAILLDLVRRSAFRRTIQTVIYMPYFLSWVILSGILIDVLSPNTGVVNLIMKSVGMEPIFFLADEKLFPFVLVVTETWKNFGYGTVIYLAAITAIDPSLYEAAIVDGANRVRQAVHITLPGIAPIVALMATLSLGNVLNAGFEQVFNLYSPVVYKTGDILDTLVYRIGLMNNQYGVGAAMGLFKSIVSMLFIGAGYWLAGRFLDYRVF